jgi:mannose-6-phosphate isomerase-like protein (cupin superfamily)
MAGALRFIENLVRIRIHPDEGLGMFGVAEMIGRSGFQSPLHVHHADDEGFHVVEGEITLWIGQDAPRVLGEGSSHVAPRGIAHAYRLSGPGATRWFTTSTPGHIIRFIEAWSEPTDALRLWDDPAVLADTEGFARLAAEWSIEILGSPGMLPTDLAPWARED